MFGCCGEGIVPLRTEEGAVFVRVGVFVLVVFEVQGFLAAGVWTARGGNAGAGVGKADARVAGGGATRGAGRGWRGRRAVLLGEADSLLDALGVGERGLVLFVVARAAAGDEEDAEEGEAAAADELDGLLAGGALKVAVEDGAADDDAEGKQHELDGDDLGRVEALQGLVDVADLHDGGGQQDEQEGVGDRGGEGAQQGGREHRGHALGRQDRVAACKS